MMNMEKTGKLSHLKLKQELLNRYALMPKSILPKS